MLDAKTATPLYVQLIEILERQIAFGELEAGERLPSESELAKQFGVSIITVRNAVGELCKRGLLERKQGKGTFVRKVAQGQGRDRIRTTAAHHAFDMVRRYLTGLPVEKI